MLLGCRRIDDAAAAVPEQLFRLASRYNRNRGPFRGYAQRRLRCVAFDYIADQKRDKTVSVDLETRTKNPGPDPTNLYRNTKRALVEASPPTPEKIAIDNDLKKVVAQALAQLLPDERGAIQAHFLAGELEQAPQVPGNRQRHFALRASGMRKLKRILRRIAPDLKDAIVG